MECPKCDAVDYGFELPDVRATYYNSTCNCHDGCDCDVEVITIVINRIWDLECRYCGGCDWRPEWLVKKDSKIIATVPSESAAYAVVETEYPDAEQYDDSIERMEMRYGC